MELEFELKYVGIEAGCILYRIIRKGIQIGTVSLDEEPYAMKEARCTELNMR